MLYIRLKFMLFFLIQYFVQILLLFIIIYKKFFVSFFFFHLFILKYKNIYYLVSFSIITKIKKKK
ncbi:hypothetical protein H8356DRAFT_1628288, partial [Neocallimastix lanati (nom. inval.)]